MRRALVFFPVLFLLACQVFTPVSDPSTGSVSPSPETLSPAPSTQSLSPSPVSLLPTIQAATPSEAGSTSFKVLLHPDGLLYVGDQVSLEVLAPESEKVKDKQVHVQVGEHPARQLGTAGFAPFGIAGRSQATLTWAWDTHGLAPREYQLHFSIQPDGISWVETVTLYPEADRPPPEPQARWESVRSECCVVYYITGTDSARQLEDLLEVADAQGRSAIQRMGIDFSEPIPVTLMPRVLGQGGFAADQIYVSYLDRNYAGDDFAHVLHHEMIHLLDTRLGGDLRPTLFVEGLAVYQTRGHYKIEPLLSRAGALLELGWYIPLASLTDDFYSLQHEIGYLEAGALVQHLVNTYGWEAFERFYRDIHPHPSGKQSRAMEAALREHFNLTLEELEQGFIAQLHSQKINPDMYEDIRLTVAYYDMVRRYQQLLDPSAYFLTAWLPDGQQMRERGIVADYLRHPGGSKNVLLENMLVEVDELIRAGNYTQAEGILLVIKAHLDRIAQDSLVNIPFIP